MVLCSFAKGEGYTGRFFRPRGMVIERGSGLGQGQREKRGKRASGESCREQGEKGC